MDLIKKLVKKKKLQRLGSTNLVVLIPKKWIDAMDWNQYTHLILEWLPHRKAIILSQNEEISNSQTKEHRKSLPISEESV